MKRKVGRKRKGAKHHFLLTQIVPMRPYLFSLMADLRECRIRQQRLRRIASAPKPSHPESYEERRKRYEATEQLQKLADEQQEILREFRRIGVVVGSVIRGEMLFPCLVDNREAFFVWYDSEQQPSHYRFRKSSKLHPIPPRWFSLFHSEDNWQSVEDWI